VAVVLQHAVGLNAEAGLPLGLFLEVRQMCMRLVLNQVKNGLLSLWAFLMKFTAHPRNSSSIVSMRFLVSGPVSSILCVPSALAQEWITPRGPNFFRNAGSFG
jgi:hypothetical protein